MSDRQYWIGVVSADHVAIGVAKGFARVNHGKQGPLARMRAGDGLAYYSPRDSYPDGAPLQAFTALGRIRDGRVYPAPSSDGAQPFQIDVEYCAVAPAPVRPLIASLSFIRSKTHWGAAFRPGLVRIPEEDFARIVSAFGRDWADLFARH